MGKISLELRTHPVNVGAVIRRGAITRDDEPLLNVWHAAQNKVQFNIETKKETFFEEKYSLNKNNGKLPIYKILPSSDSTNSPRSKRKVSTLKFFLEIYLTLGKDEDAVAEIETFLYW